MSFFNPNSFDAHDERLYDQPVNIEEIAGNEPAPEQLPEALIETNIPPITPVQPIVNTSNTSQQKQQPNQFQARMDAFAKKYQDTTLNTGASEQQEAAELRDKLLQADNLMKAILIDPALNKPSDSFTPQHIVAIKKYLQGTMYYCELLKDDLIKSKNI
jgi:hypothetical protein